jgi:hypothetical protein
VIPTGWVVTSVGSSGSCGNTSTITYTIRVPQGNGPLTICSFSNPTLPTGWVIIQSTTSSNCSNSGSGPAYIIQNLAVTPTPFINSEQDVVPGSVPPVIYICITNTPVHGGIVSGATPNNTACTP